MFPVAPLQQQSQVNFYGSYMKLYFNSILLHRILVANGDDANDPTAIQTLGICFSSSMNVLTEARNFGKLDLLYYFWDAAHLMCAFAAMMLLKVLNLASALPETAASDALEVLTGLLVAYSNTAQAMAYRPHKRQPGTVDSVKAPVANGLEAQVRLLRSIIATITSELGPASASRTASSSSATATLVSGPTPPPWSRMQAEMGMDGDAVGMMSTATQAGDAIEAPRQDIAADMMQQLVCDMDFSLDSSFMDARFLDAGLLGWDEVGVFAHDK